MNFVALILFVALTIPPAAKVLAVSVAVYAFLQGLKQIPWLKDYLNGWVAIVFNAVFSALGVIVALPVDQLYTTNTLLLLITTIGTAAGIHGTVLNLQNQSKDKQAAEADKDAAQLKLAAQKASEPEPPVGK